MYFQHNPESLASQQLLSTLRQLFTQETLHPTLAATACMLFPTPPTPTCFRGSLHGHHGSRGFGWRTGVVEVHPTPSEHVAHVVHIIHLPIHLVVRDYTFMN